MSGCAAGLPEEPPGSFQRGTRTIRSRNENRESEVSIHAHEPTMWACALTVLRSAGLALEVRQIGERPGGPVRYRLAHHRPQSRVDVRGRRGDAAVGDAGFPTIIVGAGVVPFAMDAATSAIPNGDAVTAPCPIADSTLRRASARSAPSGDRRQPGVT